MTAKRIAQADKLLVARKRTVDRAEVELAAIARQAAAAELAAHEARGAFSARLENRTPSVCSSAELAEEHGYLGALEKCALALEAKARESKVREEKARAGVLLARTEHKKVELWRDQLVQARSLEEARLERRASDEVAARIARRP